MPIHTIATLVEWKPSGSWVDITAAVLSAESSAETTSNDSNGLAFGDDSDASATVVLIDTIANPQLWRLTPIRITFTVAALTETRFVGVITGRSRARRSYTFQCQSAKHTIQTTKAYSPAFERRAAATATSATSIEDPDDPDYVGGLINWGLWTAGGRPLAQVGTYPSADFYYACEQAIIAPDWSWLAGEDMWAELLKLARACGGQLATDPDGTIRYRQPLSAADASPGFTFADTFADATDALGIFGDIEQADSTDQYATALSCVFVPRERRAPEVVIDDTTPRQIAPESFITVLLEPRYPIVDLEPAAGSAQPSDAFTIVDMSGTPVPISATVGYEYHTIAAAQQVTVILTNHLTRPIMCFRILLRGHPIIPGEQGIVTDGSGTTVRALEDNVYVQSETHARRLLGLAMRFYGVGRATYRLTGCPYDTRRAVGEVVNVLCDDWGLTATACIIRRIEDGETGATANYDLVPLDNVPVTGDFFLVGSENWIGQTKALGY